MASEFLKAKYGDRCCVKQVEVFEHEDNSALYCNCDVNQDDEIPLDGLGDEQPKPAPVEVTPLVVPPMMPSISRPANVGPNVSSGKGDWFKGTSWGN
jgi:hypothetical protein